MADFPPPESRQRPWNLNADILLHILDLQVAFPHTPGSNSNSSALISARRYSQVCRQWRSPILAAPVLWAKLVDLSALQDTSDDWKHEVLHRTGNAPLWVYGCIAEKQRGYPFFLSMLDKNWERIQVLTLQFTVVTNRAPDPRWNAMQRASQHLCSFNLRISYADQVMNRVDGANIFTQAPVHLLNGSTPALQYLTLYAQSPFFIHIQSQSIRFLKLSLGYSSRDILPSLLAGLRTLIHLERLEVHDYVWQHRVITETAEVPMSRTLLPRLSLIRFAGTWITLSFVLGQLRPAPGCSIFLHTDADMEPEVLQAAEDVINTYARNFWDVHQSRYLEMAIHKNHFKIHPWKRAFPVVDPDFDADGHLYGPGFIYHRDTAPEFSIYLFPSQSRDAMERIMFALSCTPRHMFASITHLHISKFSSGSRNASPIIQLVNNLTCVEYLAVSLDFIRVITTTLKGLVDEHHAGFVHLPALKTLKIHNGELLDGADFTAVVEYATLRRAAGLAQLHTLDLVDVEAKVVRPLAASLLQAAEIVIYPVTIEHDINIHIGEPVWENDEGGRHDHDFVAPNEYNL